MKNLTFGEFSRSLEAIQMVLTNQIVCKPLCIHKFKCKAHNKAIIYLYPFVSD